MRERYKHLIERRLNDNHLGAIIESLGETLKELGMADENITEVTCLT